MDSMYNQIYSDDNINGFDLLLFIIFFSVQIYFDFSGYSDIAVGVAKILNFNLPINFNSPFKAHSIIDFWKRWHITLSQFFRDYFYMKYIEDNSGPTIRSGLQGFPVYRGSRLEGFYCIFFFAEYFKYCTTQNLFND